MINAAIVGMGRWGQTLVEAVQEKSDRIRFVRGVTKEPGDIASFADKHEIRMYCHGPVPEGGQRSRLALSKDGICFTCLPEILGSSYFRVFPWDGHFYALTTTGRTYRSVDGLSDFEVGPKTFPRALRHAAVDVRGMTLYVYYSNRGDHPERILLSTVDLAPDWTDYK